MKKLIRIIIAFILFSCIAAANTNEWYGLRTVIAEVRSAVAIVEGGLSVFSLFEFEDGQTMGPVTDTSGAAASAWKLKFASHSGSYDYMLEIWGNIGGTFEKAIEYAYTGDNEGQVILKPSVFSTNFPTDSYYRINYSHSASQRTMTVDSTHASPFLLCSKTRTLVTEDSSLYTVYTTAHLHTNILPIAVSNNNTAENDCYILGAVINNGTPYEGTAKMGLIDISGTYEFDMWYNSFTNTHNIGVFSVLGMLADGLDSATMSVGIYSNHPDPILVDPSNLPTQAEVAGINIVFENPGSPGF